MNKRQYIMVFVLMGLLIASTVGLKTNATGVFFTPMAKDPGIGQGLSR